MRVDRILELADTLEQQAVAGLGFNMAYWGIERDDDDDEVVDNGGKDCGTVACIAGTCAIKRGAKPLGRLGFLDWREEASYLGIDDDQGYELFIADRYLNANIALGLEIIELEQITLPHAVRVLRNLAITGKVDWAAAEADNNPVLPPVPDPLIERVDEAQAKLNL